jgi:hypothetical protein
VEIRDVKAWRVVSRPPETVPVPLAGMERRELPEEEASELVLDLGYRHLPLHRLSLQVEDANFFRAVSLEGRNRLERTVRQPLEGGGVRERTEPEPWHRRAGGHLYRYSAGRAGDESLTLDLDGVRDRYLRLRIRNGDDPPLSITGASVERLQYYLDFQPRREGPYTLYLDNPGASAPSYDIGRYIAGLRAQGIRRAELGPVEPNPLYAATPARVPWSERHRWLLWAALAAIGAVLGWLLYRQVRSVPPAAEGEG